MVMVFCVALGCSQCRSSSDLGLGGVSRNNTLTCTCFIFGGIISYSLVSFHTPASPKTFVKRSYSILTERDRRAFQL